MIVRCTVWIGVLVPCMVALVSTAGCSKGNPNVAPVSGTVTLDGQPLADALVMFNPTGTEGSSSTATTDANGRYELVYSADQKGAWIGQHNVVIMTKEDLDQKKRASQEENEEEEEEEDESDTSTGFQQTAEVKAGSNTLDFPLESGG